MEMKKIMGKRTGGKKSRLKKIKNKKWVIYRGETQKGRDKTKLKKMTVITITTTKKTDTKLKNKTRQKERDPICVLLQK